ncbi:MULTISPECIES: tetratricopeptide repeat protein [Haloferax]|uniref:Tetratricopeptide repeat protein n=1 Tax=Haloferax marinum TaxID=2666143 RepID=A0A6A8G9R7_9EURY|nr:MULTISPECIES: tetratricopeptide repeat protein [Haloferax]KAB1197798.1 tetratricopeptide repeat protein [Haloferax sp. CBA1150]MRW96856.1 tetratricopeptide repeat protein [Haloferax marinum]
MTTDSDTNADLIELVFDRFDFLRVLDGNRLDKPELADTLGYSRSTVDRAVRELDTFGLVVEGNRGYTTSLKGGYLLTLFRSYRDDLQDVLELDPVLVEETTDYPLPIDVVVGSDVEFSSGPSPDRPIERLGDRFDSTSHGSFVFARRPNHAYTERLTEWVAAGHSCRIVAPESVVTALWREFPVLLETMQNAPNCSIRTGDVPPFSLTLTVTDGTTLLSVVDYDESERPRCVVNNTSEAGVAWGRRRIESLWKDATPFDLGGHCSGESDGTAETDDPTHPPGAREAKQDTDEREDERDVVDPRTTPGSDAGESVSEATADVHGVHGDPLPTTLHSQGFVRLSANYFDRVGASPPLACWRAGFDLGEVRKGYALDRERPTPDGRENVTDDLFERLRSGDDHVVVGPPGSGKSTVCMSVATRWYECERGPVLYRKSGQRDPFAATAHLGAYLAETPGHALVVVEDATRSEANAIFELVREFADDGQVTFLFDSRENEWRDNHLRGSARLESYRTQAIDVLSVPPVDALERERIVDHFEATVDQPIDVDSEELHRGEADELAPGEMYLFFHRLARYIGTTSYDDSGPTTLLDDIDGVYDDLQRVDDELGVDVGVLVNLLNAAGLDVDVPLVYVLSSSSRDESVVESALDELERSVLYSALGDTDDTRVRTVHETWSTRFLQRLLDVESERKARRRFERCLAALFSLVDDADERQHVQSVFGGTADVVRTIEDDLESWGDRLVQSVFQLGVNNPTLSALFAETDYSAVEIPDACDATRRLDARRWRARMFVNGGELERARREFESLTDVDVDELDEEALVRAHADGFAGVSEVARFRSEFERAREAARTALDHFERIDDDEGRSDVLNALGSIEMRVDNFDAAREQYERALELRADVGNETKIASTLANLAQAEQLTGSYDEAREYAHRSLQIRRDIGYRWGEAISLSILGVIENEDGTLTQAERYTRLALEIRRDIGDTLGIASSSANLAAIEVRSGRLEDAHERYTSLLELTADEQLGWVNGGVQQGLAETSLELNDPETAIDHAERAADLFEESESRVAAARRIQARAEFERGNLERARDIAEAVAKRSVDLGPEEKTRSNAILGRILVEMGDEDAGFEHLRDAVETAPDGVTEGRCLCQLADALRDVERVADALDALERAVACFSTVEATVRQRETRRDALTLATEGGDELSVDELHSRLDRHTK